VTLIDRGGASVGAGGAQAPLPPKTPLESQRRRRRRRRRRREGKVGRRRGRKRNEPPRCWGCLRHYL